MRWKRQRQRAGEHSSQTQVAGDYYNTVVVPGESWTEERALEVANQAALRAIESYGEEARVVGLERMAKFDSRMVTRLSAAERLDALADPAVQTTMRKAQLGAAATEREADYDILAGLLADRVDRAEDRPVRAAINRAVEVVDQMDTSALMGLTVFQAAVQYNPVSGVPSEGVSKMVELLSELLEPGLALPTGADWLDHLDVLGAVRTTQIGTIPKFDKFWPGKTPGYVSRGLPADSDELRSAMKDLFVNGTPLAAAEHPFLPGSVRLVFPAEYGIHRALTSAGLPEAQIEGALEIARTQFHIGDSDPSAELAYADLWRQQPVLAQIQEFWDALPPFGITAVGRVLARANAQRLDVAGLLPPLD